MTEWTLTPSALAAVSAAALVVIAVASCLGRNVYDELLQDIRDRTRDNGWIPVAAFDDFQEESRPVAAGPEAEAEVDVPDRPFEAAVAQALAEADARAAAELVLAKRDAEAADRERAAAVLEAADAAKAAAEIELAHVKQAAERTLAAKLEEVRSEADRQRAAAVAEAKAAARSELARVKPAAHVVAAGKAADAPPPRSNEPVPMPATGRAQQTLEEHLEEARSKVVRLERRKLGTKGI